MTILISFIPLIIGLIQIYLPLNISDKILPFRYIIAFIVLIIIFMAGKNSKNKNEDFKKAFYSFNGIGIVFILLALLQEMFFKRYVGVLGIITQAYFLPLLPIGNFTLGIFTFFLPDPRINMLAIFAVEFFLSAFIFTVGYGGENWLEEIKYLINREF